MLITKALKEGAVIHGEKYDYRVLETLNVDGQGYTYKTIATDKGNPDAAEMPMVVREQMMARCSDRGPDGMTVVYPEDIAPTVERCLESFIVASQECLKISKASSGIVDMAECFHANNTYYYAVEYLAGETFGEYVKRMGGRLSFEQTREALSPIFDAVRTMHRHHALHTHIYPDNVRFRIESASRVPVLCNLYSSRHFSDTGMQRWILPTMNCETGFAPPEQYREIDHFVPQVDIYALAAMMVFALSGRYLPDSRTVTENDIRALIPSETPENVTLALLKALDSDLSKRTGTVTKFREDLEAFLSVNYPGHKSGRAAGNGNTDDSPMHTSLWQRIRSFLRL